MHWARILLSFVAALILLLAANALAYAQNEPSSLPKPVGYVNDYAGVLNADAKQRLETTLTNLDREQQIQFAVLTIGSTKGPDIFDYSLAVARGWGIGSKDVQKPSLLLLVAIEDRKYFTQVSRHLEGDLPDGLVGQIQREHLVPPFKAGNYDGGITDTINTYITTLAVKRGFSTDTIFAAGTNPPPRSSGTGTTSRLPCGIIIFIFVIVILVVARAIHRGGPRSGGSSWVGPLIVNLLINALLSSGRGSRSSGWGGGGFGGFGGGASSGSSGGFGGFGGGGDFGGGGSGGSW